MRKHAASRRRTWVKIKRGLITDPEHRRKMGECLWLFEYMLDEADWESGCVYGWKDRVAADDLDMPLSTVRYQRRKLSDEGYISALQEQYGLTLFIHKYTNPREYSDNVMNVPDVDKLTARPKMPTQREKLNALYTEWRKQGCSECHHADWRVVEAHHVGKKTDMLSVLIRKGITTEAFNAELANCVPLCRNCHSLFHNFKPEIEEPASSDGAVEDDPPHMGGVETDQGANVLSPLSESDEFEIQGDNERGNERGNQGGKQLSPLPLISQSHMPHESSVVADAAGAMFREWERSVGPITQGVAADLSDLGKECDEHRIKLPPDSYGHGRSGYTWVCDAIVVARRAKGGKFGTNYVAAIIRRWFVEGYGPDAETPERKDREAKDHDKWLSEQRKNAQEAIRKAKGQKR